MPQQVFNEGRVWWRIEEPNGQVKRMIFPIGFDKGEFWKDGQEFVLKNISINTWLLQPKE